MERSEIIDVVCEVADMAVRKHAEVEGFEVDIEVDNEVRYTEEAQIVFDGYYDNYDDIATKWVAKYPTTTQSHLKWVLMTESGLYTPTEPVEWHDCAIAFYWEGVEEDLDGDIVFEPGYYLWNEHTILNWKTMAPEFDFVYLMLAEGGRLKEDGTPYYPELYRMCDKGVVVRKLKREHENGGSRPTFENRSDGYVFIIDVPGKVRISGEEFHFFEKVIREDKWMYLYDRENSVAYPIIPKVEYDAGAYDTNWLNRVLEDHNDLDFVPTSNVVGVAIKPQTVLFNKE